MLHFRISFAGLQSLNSVERLEDPPFRTIRNILILNAVFPGTELYAQDEGLYYFLMRQVDLSMMVYDCLISNENQIG